MLEKSPTERIDLLLGMGLMWRRREESSDDPARHDPDQEANDQRVRNLFTPPAPLSALAPETRVQVERRAEWLRQLQPTKQEQWLRWTIGRAQSSASATQFDQHIHFTHVVEALRREPRRTQLIILQHLPSQIARSAAADLSMTLERSERRGGRGERRQRHEELSADVVEHRRMTERRHVADRRQGRHPLHYYSSVNLNTPTEPLMAAPIIQAVNTPALDAALINVLRRSFLSNFVSATALNGSSPLDVLTGAQLARLVRLLGARETAVACRGITRIESVGAFLSYFPPEDARSVAAHIAALIEVDAERIIFAEGLVYQAMNREVRAKAILDRVGFSLLAVALSRYDSLRLRFAEQKLPTEAARVLRQMLVECCAVSVSENDLGIERPGDAKFLDLDLSQIQGDGREFFISPVAVGMIERVADEVEKMALELIRATHKSFTPKRAKKSDSRTAFE
ncbi:MAG: hypothetical protein H0W76_00590 [Pyrinomonadaceae bacterium]|nr:hypothetical protein [Pyrinomonadaceae bacterium]